MTMIVERQDKAIMINTCVYQEDYFHLVSIGDELANSHLFKKAVYGDVLNINALYKHFIDDNFEHHEAVEDHFIQEQMDTDGKWTLTMGSLDKEGRIVKEHRLEITLKDFS